MAINKGQVRPGGMARGKMVEGSARRPEVVQGIRAIKRDFTRVGPHIREKNKGRRMYDRGGLEHRADGDRAVGAFEINAITEGHAVQWIHFRRQETGGETVKNAAAIHEIGGIGRVLPKGFLRDIGWQGVEPRAVSITAGGETGQVRPVDIVLVVTAGSAGCAIGDAEIWKDLPVVIQIHIQRESPLPEIAEASDAVGLLLRLGQRRQKHRRENGDDGDHH